MLENNVDFSSHHCFDLMIRAHAVALLHVHRAQGGTDAGSDLVTYHHGSNFLQHVGAQRCRATKRQRELLYALVLSQLSLQISQTMESNAQKMEGRGGCWRHPVKIYSSLEIKISARI